MADIPEDSYARPWGAGDTRVRPPAVGGERETLSAFLDCRRKTFTLKCAGLGDERLSEKGIPPCGLSLYGPLRHLAAVERWWFAVQFAGDDLPRFHFSDDDPDFDFLNGDDDPDPDFDSLNLNGDVAETFAVWEAECLRSREIARPRGVAGRDGGAAGDR
jgi:hypothetical protein